MPSNTKDDGQSETSPLLRDTEPRSEAIHQTHLGEDQSVHKYSEPRTIPSLSTGRLLLIVLSLNGLIFCAAGNMSVMTTIGSEVAEDLDAFESANWFTAVYMITLSSVSPLAARLAYVFSPRLCITTASLFFALGGLVTSQATTLAVLLLGRELAGEKRRGLFIALVNTSFTSGVALSAAIAGALLLSTGWRPVFWVQTPVALAAGAGIFSSAPKNFQATGGGSNPSIVSKLANVDYLGALCLIAGMALLLSGLATPRILLVPIAISPMFLIAFVYIELNVASDPILPVSILRSRGTLLSCLAQLGMMAARWTILFYGPVYAIAVRSLPPATAGTLLVPTNFGMAIGSILIGWLHVRRPGSFLHPSVLSYFMFACILVVLSRISQPATPLPVYMLTVLLNGVAAGASLTYVPAHLLHVSEPSTQALALGLLATARTFAGSFASAIGGGLFVRLLRDQLRDGFKGAGLLDEDELVRKLLGSPALVQSLTGKERMIAISSYIISLERIFLLAAALAFLMAGLQACTGSVSFQEGMLNSEALRQARTEEVQS